MLRPIELIVGDRATFEVEGRRLPVEETVHDAVERWLRTHLPDVRPGIDLRLRNALAPGSAALMPVLRDPHAVVSNDTSGASGWAPRTVTEETVLAVERFLNSVEFKRDFPDTGTDVKVFARRQDDALELTVAMPLSCRAIASEDAYFGRKDEVLHALTRRFRDVPLALAWRLNCLDRRGHGVEGTYLTLTGTSAEDADSGEVGRGNRVGGLIAFARPAGAEAAAGKNPVAHVGKIYGVLSHRLAGLVHERCPDLREVYVYVAAHIGDAVGAPWVAVQALPPRGGSAIEDVAPAIRAVVTAELERIASLTAELLRGEHVVY
jgi:S-adenosylmethionine synthetase